MKRQKLPLNLKGVEVIYFFRYLFHSWKYHFWSGWWKNQTCQKCIKKQFFIANFML